MALATVAAAKALLAITGSGTDAVLASLIARASSQIETYCGRRFGVVTENTLRRLDGTGTHVLPLPGGLPLLSVSYLAIDGVEVPAAASSVDTGYLLGPRDVVLTSGRFPFRRGCVVASWRAGETASEAGTVPATPFQIEPTTDGWASTDLGVALADGTALTRIVSGTPTTGQYSFSNGVYTFAAADVGASVVMTYAPVPFGVQEAALLMAGTMLKRRESLGVTSKSLAGESITWAAPGITAELAGMLGPFRSMVPA